jgi:hypothetical protein
MNRREALQALLRGGATAAVVLASAALRAEPPAPPAEPDVRKRAGALAGAAPEGDEQLISFLNFRNGFRNGFSKTVFGNGRFGNGSFVKTTFRNR